MTVRVLAASHIHSEWSYDGKWCLHALAAEFKAKGYRLLLMTEHDRGFSEQRLHEYRRACEAASSDDILLVPGIEYSDPDNVVHILAWGDLPFFGEGQQSAPLLAAIAEANGAAVFAHPARREAWRRFSPDWSPNLIGAEVWNRKSDGWAPSQHADLLIRRHNLQPFVGLDFHDRRQLFPLGMQLCVEGSLDLQTVLTALRSRHTYACAFGRPLAMATFGWRGRALRTLESCRKAAISSRRLWMSASPPRSDLTEPQNTHESVH